MITGSEDEMMFIKYSKYSVHNNNDNNVKNYTLKTTTSYLHNSRDMIIGNSKIHE